MASEVFSPSSERKGNIVGGVSSADDGDQIVLRLDPTTKRLLVSATIASYTGVTDGEAVDADDTGTLILGTDGTNYQVVTVDSSGDLQVDVKTMPTTTVTATDLDIRNLTATDVVTVTGGVGQTVDVKVTLDSESVAVTGTFWQATQPVSGTFWQATQPVSGTFWQATQPVSATDLDIRDLTATDVVTANLSAVDNAVLDNIDADTSAIQTAVELIDDIIVAQGTALGATKVGLVGGSVTTSAPTFTTGQINQLSLTTSGALRVDLGATSANATAVKVDGSAVTQPVSGTFWQATQPVSGTFWQATQPVSGTFWQATQPVSATDLDIRDLTAVDVVTANLSATDNAVLDTIDAVLDTINAKLVTGTVIGDVNLGATDNAVLDAIEGDTSAIQTAVQIMDDWDNVASDGASVSGDVAHDGIDAGEPVKIGGKAVDLGATPTAVAAADRTDALFTRAGQQFVIGGHPNIITQNLQVTDADGAQTDAAIITVAAGTAIVVTQVSVNADNANTVDVSCRIGFGTASTPAADAAGIVFFHPGIPAGGGQGIGTGAGIIGIGASNEDLRITCEDPVTGSISVIVTYYTIAIG